jgi:preprotein translocase subunit SecG
MAGTTMFASVALIAGVILSPGGGDFAEHPGLSALAVVLLLASLILSVMAAYRAATGTHEVSQTEPLPSGLRRRTTGPRERRF